MAGGVSFGFAVGLGVGGHCVDARMVWLHIAYHSYINAMVTPPQTHCETSIGTFRVDVIASAMFFPSSMMHILSRASLSLMVSWSSTPCHPLSGHNPPLPRPIFFLLGLLGLLGMCRNRLRRFMSCRWEITDVVMRVQSFRQGGVLSAFLFCAV